MKTDLYVESFGANIRVRAGIFVLTVPDLSGDKSGTKTFEYAPSQVRSILLHKQSGSISTDALILAAENGIQVLVVDPYKGVKGILMPTDPDGPIKIHVVQAKLMGTSEGLEFVKSWLGMKFRRKTMLLGKLLAYRENDASKANLIRLSQQHINELLLQLQKTPVSPFHKAVEVIRGIEGTASRHYFSTISQMLPKEFQFKARSRQPAEDPFNALLNYGYGILYRETENALIQAGVHPYMSFMHSLERNQRAMVFDFIEPYRPWVDQVVLRLFAAKLIKKAHLEWLDNGCYLSKSGKKLLANAFYEGFTKSMVDVSGDRKTCKSILQEDAREFARQIKDLWYGKFRPPFGLN